MLFKRKKVARTFIIAGCLVVIFNAVLFLTYQRKLSLSILSAQYAMSTQTGAIEPHSHKIITQSPVDGFLAYGPYAKIKGGSYKVSYALSLLSSDHDKQHERKVGFCDVNVVENTNYNKSVEMSIKDFHGHKRLHFVLPITIPEPSATMEFRIFQYAGNRFAIESITVVPGWPLLWKETRQKIKQINLFLLLGLFVVFLWVLYIKDKVTINYKKIVLVFFLLVISEVVWWYITSSTNVLNGKFSSQISEFKDGKISSKGNEGFLVYGPYVSLRPGKYRVEFRIRIDERLRSSASEDRAIGYADVFSSQSPDVYTFREIRNSEFRKKNPHRVSVKFTVPAGFPQLEFRIFAFKGYDLSVEKYNLRSYALSELFYIGNIVAFFCFMVIVSWKRWRNNLEMVPLTKKAVIALGCIIAGMILALAHHWLMRKIAGYPYPYGALLFNPVGRFGDFLMTQPCVSRFLNGENPYLGSYTPPYFPFMFVAMLPLGFISLKTGIFWYCVSLSLFFFFLVFKVLRTAKGLSAAYSFIFAALFTLTSYPLWFVLDRGNSEGIVFVFLCLFVYLYARKKYMLSCLPLAMASGMKLYPLVFFILFLSEKKYKEFFCGLFLTAMAMAGPLLAMKEPLLVSFSGFLKGIKNFNMLYTNDHLGIFDILFNHSFFSVFKALNILYWFASDYSFFTRFYSYMVVAVFAVLAAYVIFYEKILWRKITILCIAMISFPHVSFDYTFINMYIPFLFFLVAKEKSYAMNRLFSFLFAVLLIPKNYFMIDGRISLATFMNPLIMAGMILLIIYEGLKQNSAQNKMLEAKKR